MVQLVRHLWDMGKQDHDGVKLQALEQAMLLAELCLDCRTHQKVFVFPGLSVCQAAVGKTNGQKYYLGLICVCVLRRSRVISYLSLLKGQSN